MNKLYVDSYLGIYYSRLERIGAIKKDAYRKYLHRYARNPAEVRRIVYEAEITYLEKEFKPGIYAPISEIEKKICLLAEHQRSAFIIYPGTGTEEKDGIGVCVP